MKKLFNLLATLADLFNGFSMMPSCPIRSSPWNVQYVQDM